MYYLWSKFQMVWRSGTQWLWISNPDIIYTTCPRLCLTRLCHCDLNSLQFHWKQIYSENKKLLQFLLYLSVISRCWFLYVQICMLHTGWSSVNFIFWLIFITLSSFVKLCVSILEKRVEQVETYFQDVPILFSLNVDQAVRSLLSMSHQDTANLWYRNHQVSLR